MQTLSQRQNNILRGVIETHIETSQPVGSRSIAEKYSLSFSPATIRNEMGALEEMGYLTHPHTSSGRLPTDHGYRYYLDHTSFEETTEESSLDRLSEDLFPVAGYEKIDEFLEQVSRRLSAMSQEIGLMLMPVPEAAATGKGEGLRMSLQGLPYILEKPEFQDVRKVRNLVGVFEEKVTLTKWVLNHADQGHVSVSVGHEHEQEALEDCAIVVAAYTFGAEQQQGVLAILGPKRMAYRQIVPLVSRMAMVVGNILEQKESDAS